MIQKSPPYDARFVEYCMALHGNHDEHQCHKKPGHADVPWGGDDSVFRHECYCGVWW